MNHPFLPLCLFAVVLCMTALITRWLIPRLTRLRAGQIILEIGPSWHKSKEGTPTMGGIAPIVSTLSAGGIACVLLGIRSGWQSVMPVVVTLLFAIANGAVGIMDDRMKLTHHRNLGLTPPQKLILQTGIAIAYPLLLTIWGAFPTVWEFPGSLSLNLGFAAYPICVILIIWLVNCANLTDGIDGLASSVAAVIGLFFILLSYVCHLTSLWIPAAALAGSGVGFLIYNRHPARIFLGDTGSLFLGALAVGCGFLFGQPWILLPVCAVYTIEGVSVILQVAWFKCTRGKRLFLMAPLHHHLEKRGWGEWRIVLFFVSLTCAVCALLFWGLL